MKKQGIILIAVVLVVTTGLVRAQEEPLSTTVDATWVSKYLWYGFDRLDDRGAFQPSVDVDLFDSGFSVNVWASYPTSGGDMYKTATNPGGTSRVDATEYNYTVAYSAVFCEGEPGEVAVTARGTYYDFIDRPSRGAEAADAHEVGLQIAMPELTGVGVVPSYFVGRIWQAKSGSTQLSDNYAGWIHVFGLNYDLRIPGLSPDTPEQIISFSAAAVYNDGFAAGPTGAGTSNVDHDWSHALFGVSTSFELAENVHLTPAFYYQSSWEDTVNPEDEMVFSIGASLKF